MKEFYDNNGEELVKMFSNVKTLNVLTSLDMTLPDPESESGKVDWKSILTSVLPYVDIFTPSLEEIVFMMKPEFYSQITKDITDGTIIDSIPEEILYSIGREIIRFICKLYANKKAVTRSFSCNCLIFIVGCAGFEPATSCV